MFIAGFSDVHIVGTCEKLQDPQAPVWTSVHLTNVEALGAGTLAYDDTEDRILPTSNTPASNSSPKCSSSKQPSPNSAATRTQTSMTSRSSTSTPTSRGGGSRRSIANL